MSANGSIQSVESVQWVVRFFTTCCVYIRKYAACFFCTERTHITLSKKWCTWRGTVDCIMYIFLWDKIFANYNTEHVHGHLYVYRLSSSAWFSRTFSCLSAVATKVHQRVVCRHADAINNGIAFLGQKSKPHVCVYAWSCPPIWICQLDWKCQFGGTRGQ